MRPEFFSELLLYTPNLLFWLAYPLFGGRVLLLYPSFLDQESLPHPTQFFLYPHTQYSFWMKVIKGRIMYRKELAMNLKTWISIDSVEVIRIFEKVQRESRTSWAWEKAVRYNTITGIALTNQYSRTAQSNQRSLSHRTRLCLCVVLAVRRGCQRWTHYTVTRMWVLAKFAAQVVLQVRCRKT